MDEVPTLEQTLAAYQAARTAAADAVTVFKMTTEQYVAAAIYAGHSTRDIARAVGIPKSTVHRIRLAVGISVPEPWSTPEGYVQAHNAAWAGTPSQQIDRAPFEVHVDEDGSRRYAIGGEMARAAYPSLNLDGQAAGPYLDFRRTAVQWANRSWGSRKPASPKDPGSR